MAICTIVYVYHKDTKIIILAGEHFYFAKLSIYVFALKKLSFGPYHLIQFFTDTSNFMRIAINEKLIYIQSYHEIFFV